MESRRRTIALDQEVAAALEKGAAEPGLSLDNHLMALSANDAGAFVLPPEERAELDARKAEWERTREGVPGDGIIDWMTTWADEPVWPHPRVRHL